MVGSPIAVSVGIVDESRRPGDRSAQAIPADAPMTANAGRPVHATFGTFALVGLVVTALHYGSLGILVEVFRANPVWASCAAYVVLAVVNYALNRRFTFQSDARHTDALPKFAVISLCGLALNGLLMALFVDGLEANYWIAQVVATGAVLVWNFLGNLLWSFRTPVA